MENTLRCLNQLEETLLLHNLFSPMEMYASNEVTTLPSLAGGSQVNFQLLSLSRGYI
jgi:hypothetical protein